MKLIKQKGFTAIEAIIVVGGVVSLAGIGAFIYVLGHFLAKIW